MGTGEWPTRSTVWLALFLYVASEVVAAAKSPSAPNHAARWLNTLGCAVFLAHVACAFHFYYHWSHTAAYVETARRTAELTHWIWGGGLFINYAFTMLWLGNIFRLWRNRDSYVRPSNGMTWSVRSFFLFMTARSSLFADLHVGLERLCV